MAGNRRTTLQALGDFSKEAIEALVTQKVEFHKTPTVEPQEASTNRPRFVLYKAANAGINESLDICLHMMKDPETETGLRVQFYLSYFLILFPKFTKTLTASLEQSGYEVDSVGLDDVLATIPGGVEAVLKRDFDDKRYDLVFAAILFLLMGKRLNAANVAPWIDARIRGIVTRLHLSGESEKIKKHLMGEVGAAEIYDRVGAMWKVRCALFKLVVATKDLPGHEGEMGKWVYNLLAWTECSHLHVIIEQFVIKRPDLLALQEFRGEIVQLRAALTYLEHLKADMPYVQFLTDPSVPRPTNSAHFKILTAVAWKLHFLSRGITQTANSYKGVALGDSDPKLLAAMKKISNYDALMSRSELESARVRYEDEEVGKIKQVTKESAHKFFDLEYD